MSKVTFKYQKGDFVYLHVGIAYILRVRMGASSFSFPPFVTHPFVNSPSFNRRKGWVLGEITHRVPSMVKGKLHPCYNVRPLNSKQSYMKREEQLRDRIRVEEAA
jgi:hypothetical protein